MALREKPLQVIQIRRLLFQQRTASEHRMQQRRLYSHKMLPLHRDSDMMTLNALERRGGQTGEIGDDQ